LDGFFGQKRIAEIGVGIAVGHVVEVMDERVKACMAKSAIGSFGLCIFDQGFKTAHGDFYVVLTVENGTQSIASYEVTSVLSQ
jgi:hypothetical protein